MKRFKVVATVGCIALIGAILARAAVEVSEPIKFVDAPAIAAQVTELPATVGQAPLSFVFGLLALSVAIAVRAAPKRLEVAKRLE